MAKKGKKKKSCEKYKMTGRREFNKTERQKRHEKRMARFVERRESGKCYEYKPIPFKEGSKEYNEELKNRQEKNIDLRLPIQKWTSVWRKIDNELTERKMEQKKREMQKTA